MRQSVASFLDRQASALRLLLIGVLTLALLLPLALVEGVIDERAARHRDVLAEIGLGATTALGLLYAAFYVMLASEDDALLIGWGLLLAGLALAMAATVRLNAAPPPAGEE